MQHAATVALRHHERWDGSGYPDGLRGAAIPLDARIVAVADALATFAATPPLHEESLRKYLRSEADHQFNPAVAEAVLAALPSLLNAA